MTTLPGFVEMWKTSPVVMSVLLFCSVQLLATALERFWCYRRTGRSELPLWREMRQALTAKNLRAAEDRAREGHSIMSRALSEILRALQERALPRQEIEDRWLARREEAAQTLRRGLSVLGTLSFITPLLGLIGSVLGIHHAFHSIALSGIGGPSVVAAGISEALLCTLVGVVVSVPALILYNSFSSAMANRLSDWDLVGQELVLALGSWQSQPKTGAEKEAHTA